MEHKFLQTLSSTIFLNKKIPKDLRRFLITLDKDIENSDFKNTLNKWESEVLTDDDVGLKAKIILNSHDFRDIFKDNSKFKNSIFKFTISVGKIGNFGIFNNNKNNKNLKYLYSKQQNILFFILNVFSRTDLFIKSVPLENFMLINFILQDFYKIKENLNNNVIEQYSSDNNGGFYDSNNNGDFYSSSGGGSIISNQENSTVETYNKKYSNLLLSTTIHSVELDIDIEFSLRTIVLNE